MKERTSTERWIWELNWRVPRWVKVNPFKTITRVSHFKEKPEAIGHSLDEYELVMIALNGLSIPWDSFKQTMCSRKESMKFDIVWEVCIQEEARVANKESLLKEYDQYLATYTVRGRRKSNFKKENHKESQPVSFSSYKQALWS